MIKKVRLELALRNEALHACYLALQTDEPLPPPYERLGAVAKELLLSVRREVQQLEAPLETLQKAGFGALLSFDDELAAALPLDVTLDVNLRELFALEDGGEAARALSALVDAFERSEHFVLQELRVGPSNEGYGRLRKLLAEYAQAFSVLLDLKEHSATALKHADNPETREV